MLKKSHAGVVIVVALLVVAASVMVVYASHAWGNYHWARQSNPFTLKLGDNVSSTWDIYLREAATDWSASSAIDAAVVAGGTNPRTCRTTNGRVEVCNNRYGLNGWLGLASIWVNGDHITKGTVKLNDTYFGMSAYNKPAWRRLVVCQEVGHQFGLDHQDENFSNSNLGTCMDYTNNPSGPPSNEHPNAHDYEELETIYNSHLDSVTTVDQLLSGRNGNSNPADTAEWGRAIRRDARGRTSLYVRELSSGEKVFTFVIWADE